MDTLKEDITLAELSELTALIKNIYGFDFTHYSKASLKRRVTRIMQLKKMNIWNLRHSLVNDAAYFQGFLEEITVNVTEMFRDPLFYKALGTQVLPYVTTFPGIKIWSAGCSSGEEVYSLAILLNEFGLKDKYFIYGTDVNTLVLQQAKKGIYSLYKIKEYTENYKQTGLPGTLTDHFTMMYDAAAINSGLKSNTLFSVHNLISDGVFNEFQIICCRNVFIYFEAELQEKILDLFYNSLSNFGFLCLGAKETIRATKYRDKLKIINARENIYQKIG